MGNTSTDNSRCGSSPVHPHACGEHYRVRFLVKPTTGSSPRLWGTH
ncbi:hypothetical protein D1AOALGA4SA_11478 [Olavius algarvensis Delta 1 endosymbiont]|nr:hypothetical protein D1AOALGA4SA_11478 [Olavius algarvensis Delta 1 endosymbiont]